MALAEELPEIVTESVPGPKVQDLLARRDAVVPPALCSATYPVAIKRGEGALFEDLDGNKFLDFIGGVGVLNIGYSNPEVVEAVQEQATKYFHTIFNVIAHDGYVELAENLAAIAPVRGDKKKVYFANSGAECDENAIKVAKAYTGRDNIICFSGAFHGRTNLMMALTAKKAYAKGMGPFPSGIYRAPYPYLYRAPEGLTEEQAIQYYVDGLQQVFEEGTPASEVAAILIEPIEGEGGFIPAPIEYVKALRKICDDNGIVLIADEVQCGNCRSGRYFVSDYWKDNGCAPDIMTTAKSMGGGAPISAIIASAEIMDAVPGGTIGGTYCGNPLSCASALKVMEIFKRDDYEGKAQHVGERYMGAMKELQKKYPVIGDVRGMGAMVGVEFVTDPATKEPATKLVADIVQHALQKGLMIESSGLHSNVIRFLAPLCITDEQLDRGVAIIDEAIAEALA